MRIGDMLRLSECALGVQQMIVNRLTQAHKAFGSLETMRNLMGELGAPTAALAELVRANEASIARIREMAERFTTPIGALAELKRVNAASTVRIREMAERFAPPTHALAELARANEASIARIREMYGLLSPDSRVLQGEIALREPVEDRPSEPWYQIDHAFIAPVPPHPRAVLAELEAEMEHREGMREQHFARWCLRERLWEEAEYHFSLASEALDGNPEPHIGRGIALNGLGCYEESVEAFEAAMECGADLAKRDDIRAVYEASLQGHRFEPGVGPSDDKPKN